MSTNSKENITWVCTDPDNHQYGRKIGEGVYEFREFNRDSYSVPEDREEDEFIDSIFDDPTFWVEDEISLADYTEEEMKEHTSAYYSSLDQIKKEYGDGGGRDESWEWIVAECIFEMTNELY